MRTNEEAGGLSRRSVLTGSAILLVGGVAGRVHAAVAGDSTPLVAPPLPWKWVPIDPLEAGRRAYRAYFEHGG